MLVKAQISALTTKKYLPKALEAGKFQVLFAGYILVFLCFWAPSANFFTPKEKLKVQL
jgi:hypothetical protein